jgi:hypothetical protein
MGRAPRRSPAGGSCKWRRVPVLDLQTVRLGPKARVAAGQAVALTAPSTAARCIGRDRKATAGIRPGQEGSASEAVGCTAGVCSVAITTGVNEGRTSAVSATRPLSVVPVRFGCRDDAAALTAQAPGGCQSNLAATASSRIAEPLSTRRRPAPRSRDR